MRVDGKEQGVERPEGTSGVEYEDGVSPPQMGRRLRNVFEFLSKECWVLCIFIAKNCLWPETGMGA